MKKDKLTIKKINGYNIVVRVNPDGSEDAQVSEMYAKSQGYENLIDMTTNSLSMIEIQRLFGRIPAWVRIKQPYIL